MRGVPPQRSQKVFGPVLAVLASTKDRFGFKVLVRSFWILVRPARIAEA